MIKRFFIMCFILLQILLIISCTNNSTTNILTYKNEINTNTPNITLTTEPTNTPQITIKSTIAPTIIPKPTITSTTKPTNKPTTIPKPTVTPTPTNTPKPVVTSKPTNTPKPIDRPTNTPKPTPTIIPSNLFIDTSQRHRVKALNVSISNIEKQIAENIRSIVLANPNGGVMTYIYDFGFLPDNNIVDCKRIYAYLHSNYFPSIIRHSENIPPMIMPPFDLIEPGEQYLYMYYGNVAIGYMLSNSGKCIFFFHTNTLYNWISDHNKNIQYIDTILDQIPSNNEYIVALNIANKLLNKAKYQKSFNPQMIDIFEKGISNCSSWSIAFYIACKRVGINCEYIEGFLSNNSHAWNKITFSNNNILYYDLARGKKNEAYLAMTSLSNNYKPSLKSDYSWLYEYSSNVF